MGGITVKEEDGDLDQTLKNQHHVILTLCLFGDFFKIKFFETFSGIPLECQTV